MIKYCLQNGFSENKIVMRRHKYSEVCQSGAAEVHILNTKRNNNKVRISLTLYKSNVGNMRWQIWSQFCRQKVMVGWAVTNNYHKKRVFMFVAVYRALIKVKKYLMDNYDNN